MNKNSHVTCYLFHSEPNSLFFFFLALALFSVGAKQQGALATPQAAAGMTVCLARDTKAANHRPPSMHGQPTVAAAWL